MPWSIGPIAVKVQTVSVDPSTVLVMRAVAFRYGEGAEVLHDIHLRLKAGCLALLIGPSGAGKTTLLHLAALRQAPVRGELYLFGREVARLAAEERAALRRRIGLVPQDLRLVDHLSLFDNVALPLRIADWDEERLLAAASELLWWLGLGDLLEVPAAELSMGQRQLAAVARAVVHRPALLLADEPTSHLDRSRAERVLTLFAELAREGTAVLVASHSREVLRRPEVELFEIDGGRLLHQEPLELSPTG